MNDLSFSEVYWSYWFQLLGILSIVIGFLAGFYHGRRLNAYKIAEKYCEVLNKIIWKIHFNKNLLDESFDQYAQKIASEASEILLFIYGRGILITWDSDMEFFKVER